MKISNALMGATALIAFFATSRANAAQFLDVYTITANLKGNIYQNVIDNFRTPVSGVFKFEASFDPFTNDLSYYVPSALRMLEVPPGFVRTNDNMILVSVLYNGGNLIGTNIQLEGAPNKYDWTYRSYTLGGSSFDIQYTRRVEVGPAPLPEPATWAMMLAGFGAVGFAMRRKRPAMTVSYA